MKHIKRFLLGLSVLIAGAALLAVLIFPLCALDHSGDPKYLILYSPILFYYVYLIGKDLEKK